MQLHILLHEYIKIYKNTVYVYLLHNVQCFLYAINIIDCDQGQEMSVLRRGCPVR